MADAEEAWEAAQEGAELVAEGEHEQARTVLEALIAREPNNEYAYFFLGAAPAVNAITRGRWGRFWSWIRRVTS